MITRAQQIDYDRGQINIREGASLEDLEANAEAIMAGQHWRVRYIEPVEGWAAPDDVRYTHIVEVRPIVGAEVGPDHYLVTDWARAADERCDEDVRLGSHRQTIMYDWPDPEHWVWAATAPAEEIIDWVETVETSNS